MKKLFIGVAVLAAVIATIGAFFYALAMLGDEDDEDDDLYYDYPDNPVPPKDTANEEETAPAAEEDAE